MKYALSVLVAVALIGLACAAPSERLQRLQREIDEAYEQAVLDVDKTEMEESNAVSLIEENEQNSLDDELQLVPTPARFVEAPKRSTRKGSKAKRKSRRKAKKAKRKSKRKAKKAKRKSKRKSRKAKRKSKRKGRKAKRKKKRKSKKAKRKKKKAKRKNKRKSRKAKRKKKLKKRRKAKKKRKAKRKKKRKTKKSKGKKKVYKKRKSGAAKRDVQKLKDVAAKLARKTIKDAKKKAKRLISKAKNAPGSGCKKKGCKFPPDPKKLAKKGSKYLPVDMPKKDDSAKIKKLGLKRKWSVDPKVLHGANQLDIRLKDRHRKFLITHEKNCKGPICPKKGSKSVHPNTV